MRRYCFLLFILCAFLFLTGVRFGTVNLARDAAVELENKVTPVQDVYNGFVREVISSRDTGFRTVGFFNAMDIDTNGNIQKSTFPPLNLIMTLSSSLSSENLIFNVLLIVTIRSMLMVKTNPTAICVLRAI